MRVSRFVFLSRPPLSLEVHLGVTTSPQTPFPMDFVTVPLVQHVTAISAHLPASPSKGRTRLSILHSTQVLGCYPAHAGRHIAGRTIGDICHPHGMEAVGHEVLVEPVLGHRVGMAGIRRRPVLPDDARSNLQRAHQPGHRLLGNPLARPPQGGGDFGTAVASPGGSPRCANGRRALRAALGLGTGRPIPPRIISASRNLQDCAHLLDPEGEAVFMNKGELYFRSLVKMRIAFFRIAFSSSRSRIRF